MPLTPEQVIGRIQNIAAKSNADARTLLRIYMMERFLERLANSRCRDNFIIKGGKLVTPLKIDISTEDQVTPRETEFHL